MQHHELEAEITSLQASRHQEAMQDGLGEILATRTEADLNAVIERLDMSKLLAVAHTIREHRFQLRRNANPMVYVGVVQDRHADPEIKVFASKLPAVSWVRKRFREVVAHPEYIVNDDYLPEYELHLSYEPESDYAFVQAVEVTLDY